jgi:DNA polymerase-3 subunit delta'
MSLFGDELEETTAQPDFGDRGAGEDFPLTAPRAMTFCLGHDTQEQHCLDLIAQNKLPHALLLTGLKGIGKATFAHRLAKFLISAGQGQADPAQDALFGGDELPAAQPDTLDSRPEDKAVRLYVQGAHPDCKLVERVYDDSKNRYKDAVDVAEIRKIAPFLRMSASDGGWRIVIVDDADTMNRSAQNALLKILEEPPKKTLIMLIAHRPGRLIATIHSRVQRLAFQPLSDAHVQQLLSHSENPPSAMQAAQLTAMAQGSIGNALELWEEGGLESLDLVLATLETYPNIKWATLHKSLDPLTRAGQDQAYKLFQKLSYSVLRDVTAAKARGLALPDYLNNAAGIQQLMQRKTVPQLAQLTEEMLAHYNRANAANLDKKQALLHAIHLIAA